MRKLGQHFLKNTSVLRTITETLDIAPGETVIEIGAGHGELTDELRIANSASLPARQGSRIIAIEKDARLAEQFKKQFADNPFIEIIEGDVLDILPKLVLGLAPKAVRGAQSATHYKIAGNIPYYLTGHLLRIVGELDTKPERCVFMLQKEVAERLCAAPPRMNRLAASVQFWAEPKIVVAVSRGSFSPPPKVDSAVIRLDVRSPAHISRPTTDQYYIALRALFAQPRQTILNNVRRYLRASGDPRTAAEILLTARIRPDARPQDIGVADIARLGETLAHR